MGIVTYTDKTWLNHQYSDLNKPLRDIASLCGCTHRTIREWIIRHGIKLRSRSEARKIAKPFDETCRAKIANTKRGTHMSPEAVQKMVTAHLGQVVSQNTREKIRIAQSGERNCNWRGGVSFLPYCPKFDFDLKERVRTNFGRNCAICGKRETTKHHDVHHIDYNKLQGCYGKRWALVPLCHSCHVKTNYNRWQWFNLLINYWAGDPQINFNFPISNQLFEYTGLNYDTFYPGVIQMATS